MSERILITGGAGFIGRIVGRELLDRGYEVRVLDSLIEQVHGGGERPEGLDDMELLVGDICDASCVRRALADRKSTRLNSSHYCATRMPSSARKKTKEQNR